MSVKFGTSGLRGLVAEMTDAVCAAHVAAFLRHLARRRPLRRGAGRAGPAAELAADRRGLPRAAIAARRGDGVDCGVLPTPALALEAARRGVPAMMVTGSHIPFDRNGLKFYRADGEITKADEAGDPRGASAHRGAATSRRARGRRPASARATSAR